MSSSSLLIRLIRNTESKKEDDLIKITRLDSTTFKLTYSYGFATGAGARPNSIECNADTIFRWLRSTIDLLQHDDDPFDSLQLEPQMLPSILVNVRNLNRSYTTIMNAVEFQLNNWPQDPMPPLVAMNNASLWKSWGGAPEESEESTIEDEDDEYDDLLRECDQARMAAYEQDELNATNYLISQAEVPAVAQTAVDQVAVAQAEVPAVDQAAVDQAAVDQVEVPAVDQAAVVNQVQSQE
jgi:hypothetical protein